MSDISIKCIKSDKLQSGVSYGQFLINPLFVGQGITIGNQLRRVLLGDLPGKAISAVRIAGIRHEFATIPGVREDILEILLNLKGIIFSGNNKEIEFGRLRVQGPMVVTADLIEVPEDLEIINKTHYITTISTGTILEFEFKIEYGTGYKLASQFFKQEDEKAKWNALWKSGAITFGLLVVLFLIKGMFNFSSANDTMYAQAYGDEFIRTLKMDREALYTSDVLRSMLFVGLTFGVLFLFVKNLMKETTTIIIVGLLMVFDLFMVDKRYVNNNPDQFRSAREVDMPFEATEADQRILADTTHFRVFEVEGGMSNARTSYFHKSIGGYHAAKPRRMQQLFDYQIAKNNVRVLNMLNVKYVIQSDENGQKIALQNPAANGNAWFVKEVIKVDSDNLEMKALDTLNNKEFAVFHKDYTRLAQSDKIILDSLASIQLVDYKPNHLKYKSDNTNNGVAVFSEMYYQNGWKATIDGKEAPIYRVNYVLRGLKVPAGKHTIEFKFEPEVVKTGSTIALMSSIGMLLLIGAGVYFERKKKV